MEDPDFVLPSPTDSPHRTPSSSRSQRSQRSHRSHPYEDMSPSSTPPPMPEERMAKRRSNDSTNAALDDSISPLDPRRFTPTLHASLVSEILALRRDLETKTGHIEHLEVTLQQAQSQREIINGNLLSSNKELRSVKRQMQLLEGGTLSAINDLAKERDDALTDISDLRRRLEQNQKRVKSQEENVERTQASWNREKEAWSQERRALETKVHIVEGRLKVVLSEINDTQNYTRSLSPERRSQSRNSLLESPSRQSTSGHRGRRHSAASINSDVGGRNSALSFANGLSLNLADELAFDEEAEDHVDDGSAANGRLSLDALPEEHLRPASSLSVKALKILGLPLDFGGHERNENVEPSKSPPKRSSRYVDTAIQFSPPSSPQPTSDGRSSLGFFKPGDLPLNAVRQSIISNGRTSPTESFDSKNAPWNIMKPMMVSSGCQTHEALLSPPLTPEKVDLVLATIHESPLEPTEVVSLATQTEPVTILGPKHKAHGSDDSHDVHVPTIAIIPPASRPMTPETNIMLPPRTKNASCQVTFRSFRSYQSTSMQTEEIRVDMRNIMAPPPLPSVPVSSHSRPPIPTRAAQPLVGRRKVFTGTSMLHSRSTDPSGLPPVNDDEPLARDFAKEMPRPIRSSSLFARFDTQIEDQDDQFGEEIIQDDDFFSRPTAKFMLRSGKLVSQDSQLADIGESAAASAGEAAALETLRQSEDTLPPEMRARDNSHGRISPRKKAQRQAAAIKQLKRIPSARSGNMRRAALISSGAAIHRSSNSQSTNASIDSSNPPPFAIPLRFSSAKMGKSISEGGRSSPTSSTASPTKRVKKAQKPMLRKARSGPAISPHAQTRRGRSRSPTAANPRVSIVPEIPGFQMPDVDFITNPPSFLSEPYSDSREASAPRPSVATGPARKGSHVRNNSDAVSMQQTSVVDSIAKTMVGEWMYKYVRRRKSFGMGDKSNDWDPSKPVDELSGNVTSTGVRHKRWVWLAPYERAVMWSSKQPTSGTALMGKSGRKLTIKSVLDVKDDNPMPKGAVDGPHFNRSILILTPERALKFTATSHERHFVWLTALSFLSHSPLSVSDLTAIPIPSDDQALNPPAPSLAGSLRRRPIRDSIRIAKNGRPHGPVPRSFTTDGSLPVKSGYDRPSTRDHYDPDIDSALPPTIKRFHSRDRSNTAPRAPPNSYRSFPTRDTVPSLPPPGSNYTGSVLTTTGGSSDRGRYTPSIGVPSMNSSRRGSESSTAMPSMPQMTSDHSHQNTLRMDAFTDTIGPQAFGRPSNSLRSGGMKRKDMSYWGIEEGRGSVSPVDSLLYGEMMAASSSTRGSGDSRDPFRGF